MGIPFHFRINVRQIQFLRFWQELLIHTPAADHHDLFGIAAGGNGFINGLNPLNAIVSARLATDHNILTTRQWTTNRLPGQAAHHYRLV